MNKSQLAKHKRRLDRGGTYFGYFQMFSTGAILVRVFGITQWWIYLLGFLGIFAFRYVSGWLDDKKGILKAEQQSYANENPFYDDIVKRLDEINNKLK